ncbi:RNA polymerase sigma factor [Bacteroides pyogenes]|uniref:RNA polymerase sigma factor n=1 Tax=Bacteroides pyogenes TaxID=310300 RepID=UPI003FA0D3F1
MNQEKIQELIDRGRKGDKKAFACLIAEYQALVFRFAFRLLCNEEEARDAVQETFIKVWLALKTYDRAYRFSTWIYKIASNTCYDRLRSYHRFPIEPEHSFASVTNMPSGDDIEENLHNRQLKELILRYTSELPPRQRQIFILRDVEELEVQEVEAITGLSAEKIKSNLYLARKNIREKKNQLSMDI